MSSSPEPEENDTAVIFDVDRMVSLLENVRESVAVLVVNVGNRRDIDRWL